MPELNQIVASSERTVTVTIGGDPVRITWNPTRMTREMWGRFLGWQADNRKAEREAKETGIEAIEVIDPFMIADLYVVPLMTGWNITDGGKPYPATVENVAGLGLTNVRVLMDAIGEDFKSIREEKKGSDAPS